MSEFLDIEPAYRDALAAAGFTTFDAFMRAKAGIPTSKHAFRETAPIEIIVDGSPRRFFLKRTYHVPPKHALIPLLRVQPPFSQPRREWEMLGMLREANIPAMGRVAVGERRVAGIPVSAFLLVEAVPMQWTLENWLVPGFPKSEAVSTHERRRLFHALGWQLSCLHSQRFLWPDIHPKHIFADRDPAGFWKWRFFFIDVERMTRADEMISEISNEYVPCNPEAIENLRELVRRFGPLALSRLDQITLWAGYCYAAKRLPFKDLKHGNHWVPGWMEQTSFPRLPDDYIHPSAIPLIRHNQISMDDRAAAWLEAAGLRRVEDMLNTTIGESLGKPGLQTHRERIRLNLSDGNGHSRTWYLKRYRHPPLREQIRRVFSTGRDRGSAYHEVRFARKLNAIGVPSLRTIASGQLMKGSWELGSFAITEGVFGISLEQLIRQDKRDVSVIDENQLSIVNPKDRHDLARQLGLLTRLMHHYGFYHRDLYLCHVFLTRNRDGAIVLRVIDLARMIERPLSPGRWRIKDLAALQYSAPSPIVTRADRMRFMRAYYGANASKELMRSDIHRVAAKTRRIAAHDAKRRARLTPGAGA